MALMSDKLTHQTLEKYWDNAARKLAFSGTIRENIQMGFNEYDDEHLLRICKISVDDFVGHIPGL